MLLLLLLLLLFPSVLSQTTVYSWREGKVEVDWPNSTWAQLYSKLRVSVIGIKVWRDKIYVTAPRWHAFPSWEHQRLGDCESFQYVQSMEVERGGVMWLPDNGRQQRARDRARCPAKLVLMDLSTKQVLHTYNFPENIVPKRGSFLNDIALNVADQEDKFAYISDSERGKLVVYSLAQDRAWLVQHSTMRADLAGATFNFLNPPARIRIDDNNINGLAVSPVCEGSRFLYFSPLTSLKLFRVETEALNRNEDITDSVTEVGTKPSQTDGLAMDSRGNLYMQEVTGNAVSVWRTGEGWPPLPLAKDNRTLVWADTLAMDHQGFLWATTRQAL